jgi:hypothetical protein
MRFLRRRNIAPEHKALAALYSGLLIFFLLLLLLGIYLLLQTLFHIATDPNHPGTSLVMQVGTCMTLTVGLPGAIGVWAMSRKLRNLEAMPSRRRGFDVSPIKNTPK